MFLAIGPNPISIFVIKDDTIQGPLPSVDIEKVVVQGPKRRGNRPTNGFCGEIKLSNEVSKALDTATCPKKHTN